MQVKIISITKSVKTNILASVKIEIVTDGESIIIDDARVLRNRSGQVWIAMPSYSVQMGGGRYEYQPALILSTGLQRAVEDAALPAFAKWEQTNGATR